MVVVHWTQGGAYILAGWVEWHHLKTFDMHDLYHSLPGKVPRLHTSYLPDGWSWAGGCPDSLRELPTADEPSEDMAFQCMIWFSILFLPIPHHFVLLAIYLSISAHMIYLPTISQPNFSLLACFSLFSFVFSSCSRLLFMEAVQKKFKKLL